MADDQEQAKGSSRKKLAEALHLIFYELSAQCKSPDEHAESSQDIG